MDRFLIVLAPELDKETIKVAKSRIEEQFPKNRNFKLTDNLYAVSTEEDLFSATIADNLGFNFGGGVAGVVFPFTQGNGYFNNDFIEWYNKNG